jgi:nicotinate-nucleotide adenylyltransferase
VHPADELMLLLGSDTLVELPTWHAPERIVRTAAMIVMRRPGNAIPTAEELRTAIGLSADESPRMQTIDVPLIDLSSRDIRRRVADGRTIRYMLPRAVEVYISEKGLYRACASVASGYP